MDVELYTAAGWLQNFPKNQWGSKFTTFSAASELLCMENAQKIPVFLYIYIYFDFLLIALAIPSFSSFFCI